MRVVPPIWTLCKIADPGKVNKDVYDVPRLSSSSRLSIAGKKVKGRFGSMAILLDKMYIITDISQFD